MDAPSGVYRPPFLEEAFVSIRQSPEEMDGLWAAGWRHFGPFFFRSSYSVQAGPLQRVQPLRVVLAQFHLRKSHRRLLRKNSDLEVTLDTPVLGDEQNQLFQRHKTRFTQNVPDSLSDFLGPAMEFYPCRILEVAARQNGKLIAASYLDVGKTGASSVYGMFAPEHSARGLGICTMLWEIQHASEHGCQYYYPGYAFHEPSVMDYKKQFPGTEWYEWQQAWRTLAAGPGGQ